MNNFDVHDRGMEHVREILTEQGWMVETTRYGRDDYLQINRPGSYKAYKIKVKALAAKAPVPFHTRSPDSMRADLFAICIKPTADNPEVFTATVEEVADATHRRGDDYWLEVEDYEKFERGCKRLLQT